jgi:hypothetical protein
MPSIYEALMRASEEREALKRKRSASGSKETDAARLSHCMEDEMLVLLEAMESVFHQSRKRAIQFVGSQSGQGASNMAREYARFCASATGLSILLVEPGKPSPSFKPPKALFKSCDRRTGRLRGESAETTFHQVEDLNLFVSHSANSALLGFLSPDHQSNQFLWTLLKDRFDFIVIDYSPSAKYPGNPSLIPNADGFVLVLESEMTHPGAEAEGLGLTSVLDMVARGFVTPQRVVTCLGFPVLILTPMSA